MVYTRESMERRIFAVAEKKNLGGFYAWKIKMGQS